MKKQFTQAIIKVAGFLECCLAVCIILAILMGALTLGVQTMEIINDPAQPFDLGSFLSASLLLVMGVEFVKLLLLHTSKALIEVLLFAITREMIVTHLSFTDTLMGVISVAVIFAIRKYLYTPSFDDPKVTEEEK